jgi:hypothetical protein
MELQKIKLKHILVYIRLHIQAQTLLCIIETFNTHSTNRKNYVYEDILRGAAKLDVDNNVSDFCQDGSITVNECSERLSGAFFVVALCRYFNMIKDSSSVMHLNVISGCVPHLSTATAEYTRVSLFDAALARCRR